MTHVTSESVISIRGVTKGYGSLLAVDGISLEIKQGEVFGIIGPNGAGKTTLLEMMVGMRTPTAGSISVCGFDPVTQREEITRRVSIQPQSSGLFQHLTVAETLELFASFYDRPAQVAQLIDALGLETKQDDRVKNLSGGQRHRLLIGIALVGNTEVLFLDEPTGSLDPQARREIWSVIRERRTEGRTVILTTHSMEEAAALCDRLAIIHRGKVLALGSPQDLIDTYLTEQMITFDTVKTPEVWLLRQMPGVLDVSVVDTGAKYTVRLRTSDTDLTLSALVYQGKLHQATNVHTFQGTLEDVFLMLVQGGGATGEALQPEGLSAAGQQ